MNKDRMKRLRKLMKDRELDALALSMPCHICMASGHWPMNNGLACYIIPRKGVPLCVVPHCERAEAERDVWKGEVLDIPFGVLDAPDYAGELKKEIAAYARKNGIGKIGSDLGAESFAPAWNAAEINVFHASRAGMLASIFGKKNVTDITADLNDMKQIKNDFEIERIRRVNEIAGFGLRRFARLVKPGVTGVELAAQVEAVIATKGTGHRGARRVRAFAQVSAGVGETRWAFRPMLETTTRRLRAGEPAVLELAVVADGYWCDRTLTCVAGKPSAQQKEIMTLLKKAQKAVIEGLRPGMTCAEADALARNPIRAAGYEKEFLHITGHGLGFQYHDAGPFLMPGNDAPLAPGMVFSVEPGVYRDDFGGFRFETNAVITAKGCEDIG